MEAMRILLVDDVHLERMQLAMRLQRLGHIVEAVASGQEAIDKYPLFDPDLILLDVSMPDMSGTEVAEKIRIKHPDWIPIIFLSGHDEPEMIATAIDMGGDDYLVKPVNKIVLAAKLKAMQRIAHMRHQLKETSEKLEQANELLSQQVNEDGLTQLANRRYLDQKLTELLAWHGRNNFPMTMIMIDVDHFKLFNDHYGHLEGDRCLQAVADELRKNFSRAGELAARYGGEEFVVLLSNCDKTRAVRECERLKDGIQRLEIPHSKSLTSDIVTVSQGMVSWVPTGLETAENMYEIVDKVLYKAKEQGRNRFVAAEFT
ncbi:MULTISPECIES: diguanylate cyclase domain-containing protein [Photobacterium]|uniref:diguanylate cyclase n=1 Tax=Photobacterium ganghwense TaxID=320778 RepID=A0A0J1H8R6_9GAMM|nr:MULTISPECIES: diguanylate cyclase [Photobacterium]KLV08069.1 diguanylate cyclase [Photobacterium ganghwense]MBV1839737.1 diguanylate cyclase [Photobacterium ganghwense]PSU07188.1 diguanylate cyclase response regulator [Photobacterium ganghwense]QSV15940.1 diguanylate cyclase [Photobacterium ganghwense]